MLPTLTAENSAISFTLDTTTNWRQADQSTFKQIILSRVAVVSLVAAAIFDAIVHAVAAIGSLPVALIKLVVDAIPSKRLGYIQYKLSGYNDLRGVVRHAVTAGKCAIEVLGIPAGLLKPEFAISLNERIGLYKPKALPNTSTFIKTRIWNFVSHPVVLAGITLASAYFAWSKSDNNPPPPPSGAPANARPVPGQAGISGNSSSASSLPTDL